MHKTSKLVQKCFEPKFSTARTKTEAIVCNVLAPYAMEELECDLECANFVSIFTDSSNPNSIKMFPVLVRYFKPTSGVHVKILEMTNDVIVRPILYRLYNVYSKLLELLMIIGEIQSVLTVICCKMLLYLSNLGFCGMLLCAERNHKICVRNLSRIWAKELWSP